MQKHEKKEVAKCKTPIAEFNTEWKNENVSIYSKTLPINWENQEYDLFESISMLGEYDYLHYKRSWHAGFQTKRCWPGKMLSYDIAYGQREDIGDIRTNWELNRHYQFAALAKSYYVSGQSRYFEELEALFSDWNTQNPFLYGVEWTSPMEIAIRINSWIYTYCFLEKACGQETSVKQKEVLSNLSLGIGRMAEYILRHRARYSSANNHLIIEMYAVCMAGVVCDYRQWTDQAVKILTEELVKQNFEDGVNKEMALHYQAFVMEAYGLLCIVMEHNRIKVPPMWYTCLDKMSGFLADSCGEYGETAAFGDSDEGKLLDLNGRISNYYHYILDLMGCVLERRFTDLERVHENISWLIPKEKLEKCRQKEKYIPPKVHTYEKGGYTFIRGMDRKILIGIDHGALGFGKLAAHGHADALSFQLFAEGKPVFVDSGTYTYHVPAEARTLFRGTGYHNTVIVDGKNQSEILGPFMWGRQAETQLFSITTDKEKTELIAQTCYENTIHKRTYRYCDGNGEKEEFCITDEVRCQKGREAEAVYLLHPDIREVECREMLCKMKAYDYIIIISIDGAGHFRTEKYYYSPAYGIKKEGIKISVCWNVKKQKEMHTKIGIEKR